MRVIAGSARRLLLKTPEGMDTRPTTDRIKETLFNILQRDVPGSVFLDLFSGSGGIGIEALSRGAKKAYFVDNSPKAIACIQQNLASTRLESLGIVLKQEACSALESIFRRSQEKQIDIIFMDPPYGCGQEENVLTVLSKMPYVTKDTIVIVEAALKTDFAYVDGLGFTLEREKRYKTNKHIFLRMGDAPTALL